jgi:hypothetical protein
MMLDSAGYARAHAGEKSEIKMDRARCYNDKRCQCPRHLIKGNPCRKRKNQRMKRERERELSRDRALFAILDDRMLAMRHIRLKDPTRAMRRARALSRLVVESKRR